MQQYTQWAWSYSLFGSYLLENETQKQNEFQCFLYLEGKLEVLGGSIRAYAGERKQEGQV